MPADSRFIALVDAARLAWQGHGGEDSLFSLALPIDGLDPLDALQGLADLDAFQMLWDSAPGLCFGGRQHNFDPRRSTSSMATSCVGT